MITNYTHDECSSPSVFVLVELVLLPAIVATLSWSTSSRRQCVSTIGAMQMLRITAAVDREPWRSSGDNCMRIGTIPLESP
jgi:hypothetical protein